MRMFRFKNLHLRLLITLIALCLLLSYIIKSHTSLKLIYNPESKYDINLDEFKYMSSLLTTNISKFGVKIFKHDLDLEKQIKQDLKYLEEQRQIINSLKANANNQKYKFIQENGRSLEKNKNYLILEYTKVFFQPKFCSKSNAEIFNSELEKCEYSNCLYSCDRQADLKRADALIFHQRDLETELKSSANIKEWLSKTQQIPFITVETKLTNNPNQIWVLWNDEATFINNQFNQISNLFNWTLSFKTDSEVYQGSYGFFHFNSQLTSKDLVNFKKDIYLNNFEKRINAILWFVSNCNSKERLQVALNISKYYTVSFEINIFLSFIHKYAHLKLKNISQKHDLSIKFY